MKTQGRQYNRVGTADDDPLFGTGADWEPQANDRFEPAPEPAPAAAAEPTTEEQSKQAQTMRLLQSRLHDEKASWQEGTIPAAELKARADRKKQIEMIERGEYDPQPGSEAGSGGGGGQPDDGWSDDDGGEDVFVEASGPPMGDPLGRKIAAHASR